MKCTLDCSASGLQLASVHACATLCYDCTLCEVKLGTVDGVYVWTNGVQVYKASEACW